MVLLLLPRLQARVAQEQSSLGGFMVQTWRSEEGLPGSVVRSVGQSRDGYLWVATAEGLARFNGQEFETIPLGEELEGAKLDFFRIFTPDDGSVWVSTTRASLFRVFPEVSGEITAEAGENGPGASVAVGKSRGRNFCWKRESALALGGGGTEAGGRRFPPLWRRPRRLRRSVGGPVVGGRVVLVRCRGSTGTLGSFGIESWFTGPRVERRSLCRNSAVSWW